MVSSRMTDAGYTTSGKGFVGNSSARPAGQAKKKAKAPAPAAKKAKAVVKAPSKKPSAVAVSVKAPAKSKLSGVRPSGPAFGLPAAKPSVGLSGRDIPRGKSSSTSLWSRPDEVRYNRDAAYRK